MNADATSFADPVDIGRHVDVLQVAERFRVVQTDGAAVTQRDPQADTRVSHRLDPPAVVLLYAEIALDKEKNGLRLAVTRTSKRKNTKVSPVAPSRTKTLRPHAAYKAEPMGNNDTTGSCPRETSVAGALSSQAPSVLLLRLKMATVPSARATNIWSQ